MYAVQGTLTCPPTPIPTSWDSDNYVVTKFSYLCLQYLPHYHKRYSFWWNYKEINTEYWKSTARLTFPRNLSAVYWILFVRRGFESSKFYKECTSSLAFATQKFWCFWKPISPRILHPKSQTFHHLLIFTSPLSFASKIVSSMMPSMRKVVC